MGDYGPSEAWVRDVVFDDPRPFIASFTQPDERPHDDELVRRYKEFPVGSGQSAGRIDMLLVWPRQVAVVEFKRDIADEAAIAQVLRYAGHFRPHFRTFMVVVAADFTINARYAASATNVCLVTYSPQIICEPVGDEPEPEVHRDSFPAIFDTYHQRQIAAEEAQHQKMLNTPPFDYEAAYAAIDARERAEN